MGLLIQVYLGSPWKVIRCFHCSCNICPLTADGQYHTVYGGELIASSRPFSSLDLRHTRCMAVHIILDIHKLCLNNLLFWGVPPGVEVKDSVLSLLWLRFDTGIPGTSISWKCSQKKKKATLKIQICWNWVNCIWQQSTPWKEYVFSFPSERMKKVLVFHLYMQCTEYVYSIKYRIFFFFNSGRFIFLASNPLGKISIFIRTKPRLIFVVFS